MTIFNTIPGSIISKAPQSILETHPESESIPSFIVSKDAWGVEKDNAESVKIEYPRRPIDGGVTEEIFGLKVKDPWRSLEELELESSKKFIQDQNKLSIPKLTNHPSRKELEKAVKGIYNHEKLDTPELQSDGYYYWNFNNGTWSRDILLRSKNLEEHFGKSPFDKNGPEIFFDLNKEENLSLYANSFSPSGKFWCAVLQDSGSDWQSIRVYDTVTKKPIEADIGGAKFTFGATWIGDEGYIYKRIIDYKNDSLASADGSFGMFYHRIGQSQSTDIAVLPFTGEFDENFAGKPIIVSSDHSEESTRRSWLTFDLYRNTNPETELLMIELPDGPSKVDGKIIEELVRTKRKWVSRGFTGETRYIGSTSTDKHFFFSTTDGHSTGRIITFEAEDWDATTENSSVPIKEFVPVDKEGHQLHTAQLIGSKVLMLIYLKHACASVVFINAITGKKLGEADSEETKGNIELELNVEIPIAKEEFKIAKNEKVIIPEHGSIKSISSKFNSNEFYFSVDTWVSPSFILKGRIVENKIGDFEVDISNIKFTKKEESSTNQESLICTQIFYDSHDGIRIPMFICYPNDLDLTKPQPTLLHAYGGYCAPLIPHYDPFFVSFMRNLRGIVAIAGIRGGGEYGKRWHEAAIGTKRHVAWDDFSYAAKYLQSKGLTTPELTAIYGSSNGGLLVTACTNRTPELFNTVFADVAVTDLIRFHKFTLGRMWISEFGSPESPLDFPILLSTSPLHNIRNNIKYPSISITTADHDTRVVPGHSLKYLAEIQSKHPYSSEGNGNLILGRLYENAGHESSSKSLEKKIEEVVDRLIFTLITMNP